MSRHVTVVSMDSLDKCDPGLVQLMLIDEPHALPTDGRIPDFMKFEKARKLGFGATLDGRFDGRDPLIRGLIGPVLAERTYREAVAEGAIAPIVVYMLRVPIKGWPCRDRRKAYQAALWENERMVSDLGWICDPTFDIFDPSWQILGFVDNERQTDFLEEHLHVRDFEIAMAKQMNKSQRKEKTAKLKTGETRLCFATGIYAQGVTFSNLRVMINLAGGGASTKTIQKPGRVAEIMPGKRCGVVIDYLFVGEPDDMRKYKTSDCWAPVRESKSRMDYYTERGFEVNVVRCFNELREKVKERCR